MSLGVMGEEDATGGGGGGAAAPLNGRSCTPPSSTRTVGLTPARNTVPQGEPKPPGCTVTGNVYLRSPAVIETSVVPAL